MSDEEEKRDFAVGIGNFFLLLGFILFLLFVWSDQAAQHAVATNIRLQYKMLSKIVRNAPNFDYFFMSVMSIGIGVYLRRTNQRTEPPVERFQKIRTTFGKRKDKGKK